MLFADSRHNWVRRYIGIKSEEAFKERVISVSRSIKVTPDDLMTVMSFESFLNPKAKAKSTGAVGLIQFTSVACEELGVTISQIYTMSAIQQLDYVEKYYKSKPKFMKSSRGLADLYLATFLPAFLGRTDRNKPISYEGVSSSRLAKENPKLAVTGKNYITINSIQEAIESFRRLYYPNSLKVESKEEQISFTVFEEPVVEKEESVPYIITRDVSEVESKKFLGEESSPIIIFDKDFSYENFLEYKGNTERTNRERIEDVQINKRNSTLTIKRGTTVYLPKSRANLSNIKTTRINEQIDIKGDVVDRVYRLLLYNVYSDPYFDRTSVDYNGPVIESKSDIFINDNKPVKLQNGGMFNTTSYNLKDKVRDSLKDHSIDLDINKLLNLSSDSTMLSELNVISNNNLVKISTPSINVWLYSTVAHKIFNLSSMIDSITVSNNLKGSSFSFNLVDLEIDSSSKVFKYTSREILKFFSRNDLVFIKFGIIDKKYLDYSIVDLDALGSPESVSGQDKIYDLIGLVDSIPHSISATNTSAEIVISGRDFTKALQDDEAKFFPLCLASSLASNMFMGSSSNGMGNKLVRRSFQGDYYEMFKYTPSSLGVIFRRYLSLLSNMGVVPDSKSEDLFSSYGERRVYRDLEKKALQSGIFQIIYVVMDEVVEQRKILDPNVASPDGSFSALFSNLCHYPLVEWYTETTNNFFSIIIRQPPFTKKLYEQYLQDICVSIYNNTIIDVNVDYETEFYTWYQLEPRGNFLGTTNSVALDYLPVIQLDEYIGCWGSKPFHLVSNYLDSNTPSDKEVDLTHMHEKSIEDLLTIIEATAYLPFTHTGTITLSTIDRRVKKGRYIYVELLEETFYVDNVTFTASSNSNSIEGTTVISVSRGMKISHSYRNSNMKTPLKYSYFDIINIDYMRHILYKNYALKEVNPKTFSEDTSFINRDAFNYFYNREYEELSIETFI